MRILSPLLLVVHRPLMAEISSIVAEVQPDLPFHQEENLQGIKNTLLGVPRAVVFFRWPRTSSDQHAWRELAREFFRSAFFVGLCRAPRIPALKDWPGNVLLIRSSRELKHLLQFSRWGASLGEPWAFRSQPGVTDEAPESPAVPLYLQWGYFLADAQGYLVKLSPGFRKWLEKSAASFADQRPLWQLLGWPQSQWSQVCHAVLENGELFSWVGDWHPEAGNRFQIRLYLEPWQAKDGPSRLLCGALLNETALLEVQKALLESEQRYRALVELSPDAVGVHCRGRIVYINATGARLLGATSPQELIGQPILRFIHPDCLETVKQRLRTLMEERHGAPLVEQKFVRLDGRVIDVEVAAMPMEWKGEPAVQLVVREVGQRKQVENQLRNLAEQRKRLLDMSYALLGTLELKQIPQFVIEYLQSLVPFHRLGVFLWDESKSTLKPYYTFISPDSSYPKPPPVVPRQSLLGRAAQSGQALLVNQAHTNPKSYYPHGEHFPIEHLMGLPLKAGKEVLGVIGLQREKDPPFTREEFETAQIFANLLSQGLSNSRLFAEIRRSEKKYRALFEESGEGIFISTPEGEIIDINPAGLEILGFRSREELKNANIAAYYLDPVQRLELLRRLEKKGTVRNMELKLRRPDGKLVIVEETATVVRDERGRIVALRGIFRDVTEQKQLAEQLRQAQKMESLGTLAGGIAHDFNNLLGIILGYASLLEQGDPGSDKMKLAVDAIKQAVQRGTDLVNQILTFARKSEAVLEVLDVNLVVRDVVKLVKGTFPKCIQIRAELAASIPFIEGDRGQLNQALLNLCLNARDAMPDGGTLTIRTAEVAPEDGPPELKTRQRPLVRVDVIDTGKGMDEQTRQRIFEPFFTTKERGRGTGLGLAVVYGIVQGHAGTICVQSSPDQGTTFSLYFPSTKKLPKGTEKKHSVNGSSGRGTILVVEDEPLLQDLLKELLGSRGYQVLCAGNGLEALQLFASHGREIDLVLLDFGLPGKNGWQVYQGLSRKRPNLPGILASGMMDAGIREKVEQNPHVSFVPKPYDPNELLSLIQKQIRKSSQPVGLSKK